MSRVLQREMLDRENAVAVLLYDREKDAVILIEQLRVGAFRDKTSPWILEIVAGMIDASDTIESAARREAIEESGCEIISLIPICRFSGGPGISNEQTHVFCGLVNAPKDGSLCGLVQEGEDIKIHVLPSHVALNLLKEGKIISASTIIALQWLDLNRSALLLPRNTV